MTRSDVGAGLRVLLGSVPLGVVVGAVWAWVARSVPVGVLDDGSTVVLDPQSSAGFGPMGLFVALTLGAGLVTGVAVWRWRRWRGPTVLLAATGGGVVAATIAALVGLALVELRYSGVVDAAAAGTVVSGPPSITTWAVVLAQPLGVALAQTVLVALSRREDLGSGRVSAEPGQPDL